MESLEFFIFFVGVNAIPWIQTFNLLAGVHPAAHAREVCFNLQLVFTYFSCL